MPDLTTLIGGSIGVLTVGGVLSYQMFIFKRQNQQIDKMVSIEFCKNQHKEQEKRHIELKECVSGIVEALQGKTGETGLVSAVESIAVTVDAIRSHQKNGGNT